MKKCYTFGELLLALREEYKESTTLLENLKKHISIESEYNDFYFTGMLDDDYKLPELKNRRVRLFIEKDYLKLLKEIQKLKYDWYSEYLYSAYYNVIKNDDGLYELKYDDFLTPVDGRKYIPNVKIINQKEFSELIDELFKTDLMQLQCGHFHNNYDSIYLDFDQAIISSQLGDSSSISWNGINDNINYSITRHSCPALIEDILSLKIPTDTLTPDWVKIIEKHINNNETLFNIDINAQSKNGILQVSDFDKSNDRNIVKLLKLK